MASSEGETEARKAILIGIAGVLTILGMALLYTGNSIWATLTFVLLFFVWLYDKQGTSLVIFIVFILGGLAEVFVLINRGRGFLYIIIGSLAYLIPRMIPFGGDPVIHEYRPSYDSKAE